MENPTCHQIIPLSDVESIPLKKEGFSIKIFNSIEKFKQGWDGINKKGTLGCSDFHIALERSCPDGLDLYYSILFKDENPEGFIFFQMRKLEMSTALDIHTHSTKLWDRFTTWVKQKTLLLVNHDMLVIGNVLLTGQYSINFCDSVPSQQRSEFLELAIDGIMDYIKASKKYNLKTILLKDFDPEDEHNLYLKKYIRFNVDPAMNIKIKKEWNTFDDYLADCKSKYKVRYKRTKKKSEDLDLRQLDLSDCNTHKAKMFDLYKQISKNVTFNLFDLKEDYFIKLKEHLQDKIIIKGIFKDDQMLAFYSLIRDEKYTDAHFIGYDMNLNKEYQIYHNMLFHMIEDAILAKAPELHLSRTAMEIKSSVGATGEDLALYTRTLNPIINKLLSVYLPKFIPPSSWTPRSPFKEN